MNQKKIYWTTDFSKKVINSFKPGVKLESEIFSLCAPDSEINSKFNLLVVPKGHRDEKLGYYLSVYLKLVGELQSDMRLKFELIGRNDKAVVTGDRTVLKERYIEARNGKVSWGVNKFILLQTMLNQPKKYTPNNKITICITVEIIASEITDQSAMLSESASFLEDRTILTNISYASTLLNLTTASTFLDEPTLPYLKSYKEVYETRSFCDIALITKGGTHVNAHKTILATNSPVFKTMFEQNADIHELAINGGFGHIAVDEMLRYMYYKKVENIQDHVIALFELASTYEIKGLEQLCLSEIENHITWRLADAVRLATTYQIEPLFDKCVQEIKQNFSRLKNNGTLSALDSGLLIQILEKILFTGPQ